MEAGRVGASLICYFKNRAMLTCPHHIVVGTLKGYDQLMNLVLDDVKETMRGTVQSWLVLSTATH